MFEEFQVTGAILIACFIFIFWLENFFCGLSDITGLESFGGKNGNCNSHRRKFVSQILLELAENIYNKNNIFM